MRCAFIIASLATAVPVAAAPSIVERFAKVETLRSVQLSPSGKKLLIVRPGADGRFAVEIRDTDKLGAGGYDFGAEPAEIRGARWIGEDRILVQLRERVKGSNGPGFWGEFLAVFDAKGVLKYRLGTNANLLGIASTNPKYLYVTYDSTGDGSDDVHRLDVDTGRSERVFRGNSRRFGFQVDREGEVRISTTFDPGKFTVTYWSRSAGASEWSPVTTISPADRRDFRPLGFFTDDPNELVVVAQQKDTAGLYVYDLNLRRISRTLYEQPEVDVEDAVLSQDGRVIGVRYSTDRSRIAWLNDSFAALARSLEPALPERLLRISDKTATGLAIVTTIGPKDAGSIYLLDGQNRLTLLGLRFPELADINPARVEFSRYKARDGLNIPLYLTRPENVKGALPLVVLPHGGPWARDEGGWDEWAQMLAAKGYLVAQPQFRGSLGFGRNFWLAGDREWGGKMQDDLDDAVKHLVQTGVADPKRVMMFGWSYGGYAALTAAWRGNNLYRCTIAGAAVADLNRINAGLDGNIVQRRMQKPTIVGPSPVDHLKDANVPVLVIQGDIDQTVPVSHGRDAARALQVAGKQVRYVEVKGLDHQLDKFSADHKAQVYGEIDRWLSGPCGMPGSTG